MFALTSLSYVEGGAMLRERGGSATFARHAFNELISFIAGWAILIDYLIVIAAAAITVSHYLTPISGRFGGGDVELGGRGRGDRAGRDPQHRRRHRPQPPGAAGRAGARRARACSCW